jgi:hypothetical protein
LALSKPQRTPTSCSRPAGQAFSSVSLDGQPPLLSLPCMSPAERFPAGSRTMSGLPLSGRVQSLSGRRRRQGSSGGQTMSAGVVSHTHCIAQAWPERTDAVTPRMQPAESRALSSSIPSCLRTFFFLPFATVFSLNEGYPGKSTASPRLSFLSGGSSSNHSAPRRRTGRNST